MTTKNLIAVLAGGLFLALAAHAAEPIVPLRWDFENVPTGALPEGWKVDGTNQDGPLATWEVQEEKSASGSSKFLTLTKPNHSSRGTFNLCWTDKVSFTNGEISVRLRANEGKVDQGGGLIWRAQDKNNYYICRPNPLESNIRLYYVKSGKREMLKSADIDMPSGAWHTLRIMHEGAHIRCYFNDVLVLEADDNTIPDGGGVGLWTKADAATSFDGLEIHLNDAVKSNPPSTPGN